MNPGVPSAVLAALLVSACASSAPDGTAIRPGWKSGVVTEVGSAARFGPLEAGDCRKGVDGDGLDGRRYAAVQYFSGRHAHSRVLPVPENLDLAEGDAVQLKIGGCEGALSR